DIELSGPSRSFFRLQCLEHRFDKHIRGPWAGGRAKSPVIIHRGPGCLDLLQGHTLVDHVLNPVANDGTHIAVVTHIRGIAEPAVPGYDHRAAFFTKFRDGEVQDVVQRIENTLNRAAAIDVDD